LNAYDNEPPSEITLATKSAHIINPWKPGSLLRLA
jgi:hypothetical protein